MDDFYKTDPEMCISLSLHLPEDTGLHSQQSSREIKRALVLHPGGGGRVGEQVVVFTSLLNFSKVVI